MSSVGRRFDRASSSVFSALSPSGGIRPAGRRRSSRALSLAEREEVSRGPVAGRSLRAIASQLGSALSTISRQVVGNGGHVGGTETQVMRGANLLVARPPTGAFAVSYIAPLPGTGWYDYWTERRIETASVTETPMLERMPVFVRPGAILPRQPLVKATGETPRGPVDLAIYPGGDCSGTLCLDDGISFAYRRGMFLRQQIHCDATSLKFLQRQGSYLPWWTGFAVTIHGWTGAAPTVRLGGKTIPVQIDRASQIIRFMLPNIATATTVTIDA